jgi:DNA-binding NarL/FixJ family response regulator
VIRVFIRGQAGELRQRLANDERVEVVDDVGLADAVLSVPPDPDPDSIVEALTARELDVLRLVADGLPNREIASALAISEHTVKFHLASIFGKLGVSTRTEAVRRGFRLGIIEI